MSLAARCGHTPRQNAVNAAILVAVSVPWVAAVRWVASSCPGEHAVCAMHPVELVNALFAANVCALFWAISLAQRSTWLIDPYWTLLPVMINYTYQLHPAADAAAGSARSMAAEALVLVWAARLTHSYFRREEWNFGAREDWRFAQYRERWPAHWWWMQLPVCYLSQQLFLVGVTLPLHAVHSVHAPWGVADTLAAAGAVVGLCVAGAADSQLHAFMRANEARAAAGRATVPVLRTGVWRYSRHPNYFGEQLFWWSLGLFAAGLGRPWALTGAAVNSACLLAVTRLVEERMRARPDRRAAFDEYAAATSMWLPMPPVAAKRRRQRE